MYRPIKSFLCLAVICICASGVFAQKAGEIARAKNYAAPAFQDSAELQAILSASIGEVLASTPGFKPDDLAATLIDLRDPAALKWANVSGEKQIYPASVVKMFYLAAIEQQLEDGKVTMTPELERGLHDMIVDS
ncbi:MAG TPA: hypothetical protein VK468_05055, partial [Pyrinomonadaceae bacterium]|nr:hypothetical protein [Pyrinomonadaceae bacterium]